MGSCNNSIVVNAPIEKVWDTIKDFHDLSWAAGVVETTDAVGDLAGNQIGAQRVINGAFHETLQGVDAINHTITYSIDDGPGPTAKDAVSNYVGFVELHSVTADNATYVKWSSRYDSPQDAAVGELCNPIYQALLGALKNHLS